MFYELVSQDPAPVSLDDLKTYLKISGSAEDTLLTLLLNEATECGEKYTGRSFRPQTWNVFIDTFSADRFELCLSPINTIDSITYLKDDVATVVTATDYYLKKGQWFSDVVLKVGESWPSDVDDIEHAITIQVSTIKYPKADSAIDLGIMRHVAYTYTNRGDCCDTKSMKASGASNCYDKFRIQRV